MSVTVRPVTSAVGAEILGVDLRNLSEQDFKTIEQAWYAHSMILMRGQQLSDDDLLAFSRRFGDLDPPPNQERGRISPPGYPDIYVVSNVLDKKGDPEGAAEELLNLARTASTKNDYKKALEIAREAGPRVVPPLQRRAPLLVAQQ